MASSLLQCLLACLPGVFPWIHWMPWIALPGTAPGGDQMRLVVIIRHRKAIFLTSSSADFVHLDSSLRVSTTSCSKKSPSYMYTFQQLKHERNPEFRVKSSSSVSEQWLMWLLRQWFMLFEDKLSYHTYSELRNHFLHIIGPELYLSGKQHPINYSDTHHPMLKKDGKKLFLTNDTLHKKYQKILQVFWILNSRNVKMSSPVSANIFAVYIYTTYYLRTRSIQLNFCTIHWTSKLDHMEGGRGKRKSWPVLTKLVWPASWWRLGW